MKRHPVLFEINTRVFLNRFGTSAKRARLADVPLSYWESLATRGIELVWLMGIWKTSTSLIRQCCFEEGLRDSYDKALKDWTNDDVIGSPYAIDEYCINPSIATREELQEVRSQMHKLGMKLILDFVPNHLSADSVYIHDHPEVFLQCNNDLYTSDTHTYFKHKSVPDIIFAHGRDPFFPAWTDTIQINYYNEEARRFMIDRLQDIAELCDGVRCDMAMLILNNVFQNTWGGVLHESGYEKPTREFWHRAINGVNTTHPDFLFIAEAYWNLEWELQQLGFDFTYDKKLLDRLKNAPPESIRSHMFAEYPYQKKSVRFLENHDEERAIAALGRERSIAAAVVAATVPGMRFYHDGQFDGKKIKLPVQLGREPEEKPIKPIQDAYNKLLTILRNDIFHEGDWEIAEISPSWEANKSYRSILAWQWTLRHERILVVVNYAPSQSQCRIKLDLRGYDENFTLNDQWSGEQYYRSSEEAQHLGLFIELPPWGCHMLMY